MLFLQYHHIHTTFDTTICWITKSLWQCLTFMGILRLFLCVTATVLFVGFVVSRACFFLLSPLTGWDGDRARTRSLVVVQSWKNAQVLQTRLCYSSSLSCLYFAFVRAKHDFNTCSSKLSTSTDPGICFYSTVKYENFF